MIPYKTGAILAVAAPGKHQPEINIGAFGEMRSREGTTLQFTENDIRKMLEGPPTYGAYIDGQTYIKELFNPSKELVLNTVASLSRELANSDYKYGRKHVFNLLFAGHGTFENGALEVSDGSISAPELFKCLTSEYKGCNSKLHVDVILDSCYSSKFLIDLIVESQNDDLIYPYDCFVSSLPDEKSWELIFLEHGALSFHLLHQGNGYVDRIELAKAVDNQQWELIAKALQGITVPNPVTFLTAGRQHAVSLTSGHYLEVQGAGSVELSDYKGKLTRPGLYSCLYKAKSAYGQTVAYEQRG